MFNKKQKEVEAQSGKTEKSASSLDDVFRALSPSSLAAVAGISALIGSIKTLVSVGSNIMSVTSHFEQTQKSLETVLQSADKGKQLFEDLRKFSFDTTFGVDELASASSQLLNVGVSMNDLQTDLKMLGDLAQGDKIKFQELTSIFAKIQSTGKASSMQLQQIALRGVPITQALKDMGKTGSVSAEELTAAFQKLTGEGGQFHNAMNNIIDTIEGKKGFISDTMNEILVNFGELTGLTDAYKSGLDSFYSVLDKVNNKFAEWNENPMVKALIQQVLVVAIGLVATTITVALIPALAKVIFSLHIISGLMTAIAAHPAVFVIGLITAATAGIVAGLNSLNRSQYELAEATAKANDELERQLGLMYKPPESRNENLSNQEKYLNDYQDVLKNVQDKLDEAKENKNDTIEKISRFFGKPLTEKQIIEAFGEDVFADVNAEIERYSLSVEKATVLVENQASVVQTLREEIENTDPSKLKNTFDSIYEKISSSEKELEDLLEKLDAVNKYKGLNGKAGNDGQLIKYDVQTQKNIDDTVAYLQKKIDNVKLKIQLENAEDWQKELQKALGMDDKVTASLLSKNGAEWIKSYMTTMEQETSRRQKTDKAMGMNADSKSYLEAEVKQVMSVYDTLMKAKGNFGIQDNGKLDNTTQALLGAMDSLKNKYLESGGTIKEWEELLGNSSKKIEKETNSLSVLSARLIDTGTVGGYAGGKAISMIQGTGIGSAAEGAMEGASVAGPWGALIGAILGLLTTMEHWQDFLDELDELVEPLKPTLDAIIDLLIGLCDILEGFAAPVQDLLSWISSIIKLIASVFKIIGALAGSLHKIFGVLLTPLTKLAEGIEWVVEKLEEFLGSISDANDKEEENKTDLTGAYKTLLEAMKEQEEYYLKRKKELNSDTYIENATKVNDMIITPQGKFSTAPDDYIIATKNPGSLGSDMNVRFTPNIIIQDMNNSHIDTQTDNFGNILIKISQKVASDYANGDNGWGTAFAYKNQQIAGRNLAL